MQFAFAVSGALWAIIPSPVLTAARWTCFNAFSQYLPRSAIRSLSIHNNKPPNKLQLFYADILCFIKPAQYHNDLLVVWLIAIRIRLQVIPRCGPEIRHVQHMPTCAALMPGEVAFLAHGGDDAARIVVVAAFAWPHWSGRFPRPCPICPVHTASGHLRRRSRRWCCRRSRIHTAYPFGLMIWLLSARMAGSFGSRLQAETRGVQGLRKGCPYSETRQGVLWNRPLECFYFAPSQPGHLCQDRKTRKDSAGKHVYVDITFFTTGF